ncbi:leucine-rich repeat containing G protein-coupled receptor 4 [Phytophthora pseudosyringae]|uniref:Leucine-rich repeat containing G protein-coupled receptor 4 n=1 Tax=Phytophthora pseudosyringae TaxID=221518 RepID=A0A8T1W8M9_9STRA|nr:leucine-rich repeat containing G protein-coupled receptor 4 [Phytophthora pseudosyringae]
MASSPTAAKTSRIQVRGKSDLGRPEMSSRRASRHHQLTLTVSRAVFVSVWSIIAVLHAACGGYLVCTAMAYWFLSTPNMALYTTIWSVNGNENYRLYGVVFGFIGGLHAVRLMQLVLLSIRARRLELQSNNSSSDPSSSASLKTLSLLLSRVSSSISPLVSSFTTARQREPLLRSMVRTWRAVVSSRSLFSVESPHFSTVFAARELVEAGSQTYQAYRASMVLSSVALNSFNVVLLITNCWSTAATEYFLRKSPALLRVALLLSDVVVSFGMLVGVPLAVFLPYVRAFSFVKTAFKDPNFLHDTVRVSTMSLENQLIFACSFTDFVAKLIPHFGILLSLLTVAKLIERPDTRVAPQEQHESARALTRTSTNDLFSSRSSTCSRGSSSKAKATRCTAVLRAPRKWEHRTAIIVFFLWGFVVFSLHVAAAQRAAKYQVAGCRTMTRPWFSSGRAPCSSLIYDCHARNCRTPDDAALEVLDPGTLVGLAFVHCPALEMPATFQNFTSLMMLHVFNSTVVSWNIESSISASRHTRLKAVFLRRTRLQEIPVGMLQPLPHALSSMRISATNLSALPDDLTERWGSLKVLAVDDSNLTSISPDFFAMGLYVLSFMGNQVQTIPAAARFPPSSVVYQLQLNQNPIQELPESLMSPNSIIMSLNVQNTRLQRFPAWVETQTRALWAHGTPFCESSSAALPSSSVVKCFDPGSSSRDTNFPIALFEQLYAIV